MAKRKFFLFTVFLISVTCLAHAAANPLKVRTQARPVKVTVGDEIRCFIQIDRDPSYKVLPPTGQENLAPFEIKGVRVYPSEEKRGRILENYELLLTIWELGDLAIPRFPLRFSTDSGYASEVMTQEVPIQVVGVARLATDGTDIRPIKPPVSFGWIWLYPVFLRWLAGLLLIALIAKIILRRIRMKRVDSESLKSPDERAFLELGRLKNQTHIENGRVQEFYIELSNISKRYLERRFQLELLELTTEEIRALLRTRGFEEELLTEIEGFLSQTDLVKFARVVPPKTDADKLVLQLETIVKNTVPVGEAA